MNSLERRAVSGLAAVYILRMLGLFMIFPVFALYAPELEGATATLIGLALGIYGLTQALLQIPMGMLSDWLGRRRVAMLGMAAFAAGSLVCMSAESIGWMVVGRALQGGGAVAAVLTAWLADLTRESVRPIAMLVVGIAIGGSFVLSLILGPLLYPWLGLPGIFGLIAGMAALAMLCIWSVVPEPDMQNPHAPDLASLHHVTRLPLLVQLDVSVFALHAVLTACFVVLPLNLSAAGLASGNHWWLYLPAMLLSLPVAMLCLRRAGRAWQGGGLWLPAVVVCGMAGLMLQTDNIWWMFLFMCLFFIGFNYLEAALPAWVASAAPVDHRGAAMGVYSTAQFLGAFVGGLGGGWLNSLGNGLAVGLGMLALALIWLLCLSLVKPDQTASV